MLFSPGDVLFREYRIERFLKKGSAAEIYLAVHLKTNDRRVLKILARDNIIANTTDRDDAWEKNRTRFRIEALLGTWLGETPYIVRVYDSKEDIERGLLVLVMEYMAGGSLKDRIVAAREANQPGLPIDMVVNTAYQVALGLSVLHRHDIVHRDIKPSNILYTADGVAKISDLGIVQIPQDISERKPKPTLVPMHPGTPDYMSPEQENQGGALGASSDIYSLGATLFEALTLHLYKLRLGTRPSQLRPSVPRWLDRLIAKMLAHDYSKRFSDGAELAQALNQRMKRPVKVSASNTRTLLVVLVVAGLLALCGVTGAVGIMLSGWIPGGTAMRTPAITPQNERGAFIPPSTWTPSVLPPTHTSSPPTPVWTPSPLPTQTSLPTWTATPASPASPASLTWCWKQATGDLCVYSMGTTRGGRLITLKTQHPVLDLWPKGIKLIVEGVEFQCDVLGNYPNRAYCVGAYEGSGVGWVRAVDLETGLTIAEGALRLGLPKPTEPPPPPPSSGGYP